MKKILLIEDQAAMRRNIAFILGSEGFNVCTAANGREGIEVAKREKPDLILCDVMMPEMDGHGVVQTLRQDPEFEVTPFIFLTAKGDKADVRTGMNFGADDYLTKPVLHDDLVAAIKTRLSRARTVKKAIDRAGQFEPDFTNHPALIQAFGLTPREAEILSWLAQGKSNADIATLLGNSEGTVKQHVGMCFRKMNVENRSSATLMTVEALSRS